MSARIRTLALSTLATLCTLAGVLVLSAQAPAADTHKYLFQFSEVPAEGPKGEAVPVPGPISAPSAMTVDSGSVWVAEHIEGGGNFKVDEFNASSGAFVTQLAQPGPSLNYFDNGIAVGHATGEAELYVGTDAYPEGSPEGAVAVYNTAGELQAVWNGADTPNKGFGCFQCNGSGGVAVDNSTSLGDWAAGDVYVSAPLRGVVDVFKPEAGGKEKYLTQLTGPEAGVPFNGPFGVAVSGFNGDVLVVDGSTVDVFEPTVLNEYALVRRLAGPPSGPFNGIAGVTVDGGNGDIYVADHSAGVVDQFSAEGTFLGRLTGTPAGPFGEPESVAVDQENHHVYVGDHRAGTGTGTVDVFGPNLVIPDVTNEPSSNVQPASVTLNGIVNPDGVQVSNCHFEYGTTPSYGQSVPCAQTAAEIGAGNAPVAVSAAVSGLTPGVLYHFRLSAANTNGTNTGLDRLSGPPQIDGESVANVTQTTATLKTQVNPDGVDTTYRFEYGPTASYGTNVPAPDGDLGSGESDQAPSVELKGLQAGMTYHYRVVAVNAAGTVTGEDQTFTTIPPLQIDSVTISDVSATSASVHAQINPLGTDTTYHLEYGTSTSYGTSMPVPDEDIGSGTGAVTVTQQLTGLQPNTTYHLRIVAQNSLGAVRSRDHTFNYATSGGGLPDNRAYEMVTPPNKNGAVLGEVVFGLGPDVAADGSRLMISGIQCFAGAGSCNTSRGITGNESMFARTSGGWVTTPLAPPATRYEVSSIWNVSADAGTALFSMPTPPQGKEDLYVRRPDGSFVDVGPIAAGGGLSQEKQLATADFSHIVYGEGQSLWPFDASRGKTLYEYVGAGNSQPVLVGVSGGAGSTDLISTCGTQFAGTDSGGIVDALSASGRTVYFTASACSSGSGANAGTEVPADTLYARIDESETVDISRRSPADCSSVACQGSPAATPEFEGASVDGSKAFFTSTQQLTDSASQDSQSGDTAAGSNCWRTTGANGCNLYEYDLANPTGHNLVSVSAGDTSGGGPRVQGVMAVSADGSHVYFVAKGVLSTAANSQGQTARAGAENLYLFERDGSHPGGHTTFIAILSDANYGVSHSDSSEWIGTEGEGYRKPNVTPDGRFLVFTSQTAITRDDTRPDGGPSQVFRYDAQTDELARISIGEQGFNDNGHAGTGNVRIVAGTALAWPFAGGLTRTDATMSNDGAYVFFQSPIGLTSQALNDVQVGVKGNGEPEYAQNVYEYHNGHVYLLSDGRDVGTHLYSSSVQLLGSDTSGANVFFTTVDPLVPQDSDTQLDVYDARICTSSEPCIKPAPPALPPCLGEACHGTPAATPSLLAPGSVSFNGAGNLTSTTVAKSKTKNRPGKCKKGFVKKKSRCVKARHAKKAKRSSRHSKGRAGR